MTSSTSPITAMRPSARVLITLLAALSLVFSQLVGFAASAEEIDEELDEQVEIEEVGADVSPDDQGEDAEVGTEEQEVGEQVIDDENQDLSLEESKDDSQVDEDADEVLEVLNEPVQITTQTSGQYSPTGNNGDAYTGPATQYVLSGNPSCSDLGNQFGVPTDGEIKFDPGPSKNASQTKDGVTVTITDRYQTRNGIDGLFFDYTVSGGTVLSAFMKQGSGGMFYLYGPPGVTGDFGLHSQEKDGKIWADVSHISFCYVAKAPAPELEIEKTVDVETSETVGAGESFTYSLKVSYTGDEGATATKVKVTDTIDLLDGDLTLGDVKIDGTAVDFEATDPSCTLDGADNPELECGLDPMDSTSTPVVITITINVPTGDAFDDVCGESVNNTATVNWDGGNDTSSQTTVNLDDCALPAVIVIRVEKEFDGIDPEDEPAFRVDLTTDRDSYDLSSGQFALLAEVDGKHTSSVEGDGEGRAYDSTWWQSERYVPLASDGTYSVEESNLPSGFRVVSGEGDNFDYNEPSDSLVCGTEPDFESDQVAASEVYVRPVADLYCTHTVVNERIPTTITSTPRVPDIDIVKTAVSADVDFTFDSETGFLTVELAEGESAEITYEYVITNEGNESLDTLGLDDNVIGDLTGPFIAAVATEYGATFPVNGEVTVTATYTTTAADFAAGFVTNVATVTGTGVFSNTDVDAEDDETINITAVLGETEVAPDISIVKSAIAGGVVNDQGQLEIALRAGQNLPVTYEFVITNTGEDDLTELTLMDDKIGDISEVFRGAVITEYGAAILPVGGSVTVTAIHDVSLDDFTNGTLTNVANVTGIGVDSERTVIDSDDETVVSIEVRGEIEEEPPVTPVVDTTDPVSTTEQLPRTGFDTGALTSLGLLLAAIGAGVLLLGRRREEGDLS